MVGESGCGKSVTALSILGLVPSPPGIVTGGRIWFEGEDLRAASEERLREVRGDEIAMIFQEPMTSLNPVFPVGEQIAEALVSHRGLDAEAARERAIALLARVGIPSPETRVDDYPHQMSGGMCQRVMIAMALACDPKLLIADEPTTALDVTVQAQILDLLRALQRDLGTAVVLSRRRLSLWRDPDRHRSHYRPAFGSASDGIDRPNQLWELDSSPADVLCTDGRYQRVAAIDVGTRRTRLVLVKTSKASAIALLLRRCIVGGTDEGPALPPWGVPEKVKSDQGSDYTSMHIRAVLEDLAIVHEACPPFSPWLKPHIERFFKTLSRDVDESLPGFAGHNVAEASALRNQKSFAQRRGDSAADTFQVALSAEELQAVYDRWIEEVYHRRPHDGLGGATPYLAAAGHGPREVEDVRALDVLLAEPAKGGKWRTVVKDGVHVDAGVYMAPELGGLVGAKVQVRLDPADLGRVILHDEAGRFLCIAEDPARTGLDRRQVALAAARHAAAADKQGRALARQLKRDFRPEASFAETMDAAREARPNVVAFTPPASGHETPALGEAGRAAEAGAALDRPPAEPDAAESARLIEWRQAEAAQAERRRRRKEQEEAELLAEARALVDRSERGSA